MPQKITRRVLEKRVGEYITIRRPSVEFFGKLFERNDRFGVQVRSVKLNGPNRYLRDGDLVEVLVKAEATPFSTKRRWIYRSYKYSESV